MRVKWVCTLNGLTYTLCSFVSKRHGYALRRKTSPNLSKSIFPPNYWHQLKSSTKTKMGNFSKEFWRQQHPVFPGGHQSKYCCLTSVIGRELVYSTRYGRWQGNEKISRFIFNKTHTYLRMYKRFCTPAGLKCCRLELILFLHLPTGVLSISSSLKPCVLSTFVHKIFQIPYFLK